MPETLIQRERRKVEIEQGAAASPTPERDANQPSGHSTPAVPRTLMEAIAKAHR